MDDVRLLRISEVAELLMNSRTKVYELVASGQIPSLHLGRIRRVPLSALRDWINAQIEPGALVYSAPPLSKSQTRSNLASPTSPVSMRRAGRTRPALRTKTLTQETTTEASPFFRPWMPRPMDKDEYKAWVAHLNAHPEEKALVLEEMERYDASLGKLRASLPPSQNLTT